MFDTLAIKSPTLLSWDNDTHIVLAIHRCGWASSPRYLIDFKRSFVLRRKDRSEDLFVGTFF